jgi:hypothetical protein
LGVLVSRSEALALLWKSVPLSWGSRRVAIQALESQQV